LQLPPVAFFIPDAAIAFVIANLACRVACNYPLLLSSSLMLLLSLQLLPSPTGLLATTPCCLRAYMVHAAAVVFDMAILAFRLFTTTTVASVIPAAIVVFSVATSATSYIRPRLVGGAHTVTNATPAMAPPLLLAFLLLWASLL